jgi:hypothetical protein
MIDVKTINLSKLESTVRFGKYNTPNSCSHHTIFKNIHKLSLPISINVNMQCAVVGLKGLVTEYI